MLMITSKNFNICYWSFTL